MLLFRPGHNRREGENGKKKKKIKEETKKEEGNERERNIWREICPVLPEPTNPQDHPGYKWKHAKKKRGNAFHRAATFHLSALKMPGYHFQNLYKNTAFYPQFPLVTNHFLLAIHFKKLWQKSALGKQHVISIPRGKLVSSHSESWLVNKSINPFWQCHQIKHRLFGGRGEGFGQGKKQLQRNDRSLNSKKIINPKWEKTQTLQRKIIIKTPHQPHFSISSSIWIGPVSTSSEGASIFHMGEKKNPFPITQLWQIIFFVPNPIQKINHLPSRVWGEKS